jgi:hypothetical protein
LLLAPARLLLRFPLGLLERCAGLIPFPLDGGSRRAQILNLTPQGLGLAAKLPKFGGRLGCLPT